MGDFYGFETSERAVNGREYIIVCPEKGKENGHWALKTEYLYAFPGVELKLLDEGYHIAHVKSISRWNPPEDTDARAKLAEYMHKELGLRKRCAVIGMSCGGMQGINFAAKYPEYVSCMYLDAPVVNLLSCPAGLGSAGNGMLKEFSEHMSMGVKELLSFRGHPLDRLPLLVKSKIPVILVCGDSDTDVPYDENGIFVKEAYEKNGCIIKTIIKEGVGHHPHGLEENDVIVDFIKTYDI